MKPISKVNNPWTPFDVQSVYELESDKQAIERFNSHPRRKPQHKLQTQYFPEPFLGDVLRASVVLLNLNPGVDETNSVHHQNPIYLDKANKNLTHAFTDYPFFPLHPDLEGMPCHKWWSKKLGSLIRDSSLEQVSRQVACIELHGYPSVNFNGSIDLPSMQYSGYLLQKAIEREALIVIIRGRKIWERLVPALKSYAHIATLNSPQSAYISLKNIGTESYQKTLKGLTSLSVELLSSDFAGPFEDPQGCALANALVRKGMDCFATGTLHARVIVKGEEKELKVKGVYLNGERIDNPAFGFGPVEYKKVQVAFEEEPRTEAYIQLEEEFLSFVSV